MKNFNKFIIILLIILAITSIYSIYSASIILGSNYSDLWIKQIIWYIIGFIIIIIVYKIKNEFIFKHIWKLYIFGNLLLLMLLFCGKVINGAILKSRIIQKTVKLLLPAVNTN